MKDQLDADIKTAMLGGDKTLTTTLRGLKSVILNAEVAKGLRDEGLPDAEIIDLFGKEAKKRQESADMYIQGGSQEKADAELLEKRVIRAYLPQQISDAELDTVVNGVIEELGGSIIQAQMGQAIGKVRALVGATADGGRIATAVKGKITS